MVIVTFALLALTMIPLFIAARRARSKKSYKGVLAANIVLFFVVAVGSMLLMPVFGAEANPDAAVAAADTAVSAAAEVAGSDGFARGMGFIGAALSTGMSCIGAGVAVAGAASSAIGATSENPNMLAKSLIFVALAEGVALYGMLISFQIIGAL